MADIEQLKQAQRRAREHEKQVEEHKKHLIIQAYREGRIRELGNGGYSVPSNLFVEGCITMVDKVVREYKAGKEGR